MIYCILSGLLCFASPLSLLTAQETPSAQKQQEAGAKKKLTPIEEELKRSEREGGSRFFEEFMQMLYTLGMLVAVLMVGMWILKRLMAVRIEQANISSAIKIQERRNLTPKTTIYILGIFGKSFAIAESSNGITLLGEGDLEKLEKAEKNTPPIQ